MKRRLFCLLLCVLMALTTVLTSCSEKDETEVEMDTSGIAGKKAMTLVLYSICEPGTTEEAIESVQEKLNVITEAKFNTHIILRLFTEDKYYDEIESRIKEIEEKQEMEEKLEAARKVAQKAAKAAGVTTSPPETTEKVTETEETLVDEFGLKKTVYPEVDGEQLDIFLINDYSKYKDYYDRGVLVQLDEELSVNSKALKDYIYPTFLNAVRIEGGTYAIPNNHVVGEYQYMLINRELFDKYYFDIDKITVINDLNEYVETVAAKEKAVTPVLDTIGVESFLYYPMNSRSVIAGYAAGKLAEGSSATPKNIFAVRQYKLAEASLLNWNKDGSYVKADSIDGKDFGVAFVAGDYALRDKYEEDYYVVTYKYPNFDNSEAYAGMYAVGAFTKSTSRCMEVITLLTLNEDFRNIFQYGVEGEHFERDEYTGDLHSISNEYKMNPLYTGNQFKLWQSADMTDEELELSADKWAAAKLQNGEMSISPYLGFVMKTVTPEVDEEEESKKKPAAAEDDSEEGEEEEKIEIIPLEDIIKGVKELDEKYFAKLDAYKPGKYTSTLVKDLAGAEDEESAPYKVYDITSVEEYIDMLAEELAAEPIYIQATYKGNPLAPATQFTTWYSELHPSEE